MGLKAVKNIIKVTDFKKLVILIGLLLAFCGTLAAVDCLIPSKISLFNNNSLQDTLVVSYTKKTDNRQARTVFSETDPEVVRETVYVAKLFNLIPIKEVTVTYFPGLRLIPGGMLVGVEFHTEGVLIIGLSESYERDEMYSPFKTAGLRISDIIISVNEVVVNSISEIDSLVASSNGKPLRLKILRNGEILRIETAPCYNEEEGVYKMGWWLRDSTAGSGTITFINPANGVFGALGHGICDPLTGDLLSLRKGTVVYATVGQVLKGSVDNPGELKSELKSEAGQLLLNTEAGIFGTINSASYSKELVTLPVGSQQEVKEGKAVVLATVDEKGIREFEVRITEIYKNESATKNFSIEVTDKELINITGGIVQGMSGSPIIQDGKIVGAMTHVLVSNPQRGYGIFIQNMIEQMAEYG